MGDNKKRPVYLNLLQIRLPIIGVVSVLHRISGVVLVLLLPLGLLALQASLTDPQAYAEARRALSHPLAQAGLLVVVWLLVQHLYSGVRHLLLDLDIGVEKRVARASAWATFAASGVTVVLLAVLR
jgi:succinate dehydrogenase / fumarate reductase cytochrome b subunit